MLLYTYRKIWCQLALNIELVAGIGRGQAAARRGAGALAALAGRSLAVDQAQPGVCAASIIDLAGALVLRALLLHGCHAVHFVAAKEGRLYGLLARALAVHAL